MASAGEVIAIAATFTVDPVAKVLSFWNDRLQMGARVAVAPYNQLFQQLLDPASLLASNASGASVILLRLEDWLRRRVDAEALRVDAGRFVDAVKLLAARTRVPIVLALCPASPLASAVERQASLIAETESAIAADLETCSGVQVLSSSALLRAYPVASPYDPQSDALGHIPYTPEFSAGLGTTIMRRLHALRRPPYKVVVLDCDETLWQGTCGEDGPLGVRVTGPYSYLQQFMIAQCEGGMLLAICSRNHPDDVAATFRQNPAMVVREDHLVRQCVGWGPKSESLRLLSLDLGVGLDAFIFIDDNPVECAQVRDSCPEVLTLCLPRDAEDIPRFLDHVWAFDRPTATEEDRHRVVRYRQEFRRRDARAGYESLGEFIAGLELEVNVGLVVSGLEHRVAQLTRRANQFNLNGSRYSESQIEAVRTSSQAVCMVVDAKDRFGEYGLVGAAVVSVQTGECRVDGLWMSCRALGRGIESKFFGELGALAIAHGCSTVSMSFVDSGRNARIRSFLLALVSMATEPPVAAAAAVRFAFAADALHTLSDAPLVADQRQERDAAEVASSMPRSASAQWDLIEGIASELCDANSILRAMRGGPAASGNSRSATSHANVEEELSAIWAGMLGGHQVEPNDDFFALGGDSLLAVEMLTTINTRWAIELPVDLFFETDLTVTNVALAIKRAVACQAPAGSA
jgi:FkbH-like protein